ncbi:hypothetical protein [Spirosoma validum]|uniref:Uncharacterized protein n=1 Tax=Spirosoma validum TaxID=2771355 RepID=A0A927B170_9BACT|nr:hypothetical protein [Spirosoma validum]MBD2753681.1 hypothetical protein [Spirosoma validum]
MVAPVSQSPLERVIQNLGYRSTDDFLHIQLRNVLEQKIAYYQSRIDFFQKKYEMNFDEFRQRVVDKSDSTLSRFGIIEKENDDNDWDDAIDFLTDYTTYLHQIRP